MARTNKSDEIRDKYYSMLNLVESILDIFISDDNSCGIDKCNRLFQEISNMMYEDPRC